MVESAVLDYMDAMYSVNANYTNEAHDAMGTCGYPMGKSFTNTLPKQRYILFS